MTRLNTFTALSFRTNPDDSARRFKAQPGMGIGHLNSVLISRTGIRAKSRFLGLAMCHDINLFSYDLHPAYTKISVDFQVRYSDNPESSEQIHTILNSHLTDAHHTSPVHAVHTDARCTAHTDGHLVSSAEPGIGR